MLSELYYKNNKKRGRELKKKEAGQALTRTEYVHQTKYLFANLRKEIAEVDHQKTKTKLETATETVAETNELT